MTSNEKSSNYKVVDIIESYNFRINFISIQVYIKKLCFFKKEIVPIATGNGGRNRYSTPRGVTGDRSLPPFTVAVRGYFCQC
jgi:hypothetical protein